MHDGHKTFVSQMYTEINFLMAKVMTYLVFNRVSLKPRILHNNWSVNKLENDAQKWGNEILKDYIHITP